MQLTHTDAGRGFTRRELLHRMALRSKARAARLRSGGKASAPVTPARDTDTDVPYAEYLARFAVGTPPQPVQLVVDTGSDLTWTQCVPCPACFDQALPYFDPSLSSSFGVFSCSSSACQDLPLSSCGTERGGWGNQTCVYTYSYGDRSVTTGLLLSDTFTFAGAVAVPNLAFGCGFFNQGVFNVISNMTGIAGFGRGALSLPSQLKVDNFSYCFTPVTGSAPSTVLLGLPANLHSGARGAIQTTPLIQNPADQSPTFYYLSLKGITVGSWRLPVPESAFAFTKNGTGGTIIDSGTAFTGLPTKIYRHLRDAFVSQLKELPVTNDDTILCFGVPPGAKPDVPKLALHFEGATLDLPRENYIFEFEEAGRSNICLAIFEAEGQDDMTILGNYQQQNMHVLYDLAGNKLSFVPAHCDRV
ncbi:hypothetical protein EJB05_06862, partial [Eragrostis curvula]